MKYLLRKIWHTFNCKVFDKNRSSNLPMYTTSLNKSSIINGNKGDTKIKYDCVSACTTNTLTTSYVESIFFRLLKLFKSLQSFQ